MKKIRITENNLRKVLRKLISEQYDTESISEKIIDKLSELGVPDQYLDIAKVDLIEIEGTEDFKEKRELIFDFKNEINRIFNKFKLATPKSEEERERLFRMVRAIDIMTDSLAYKMDIKNINLN